MFLLIYCLGGIAAFCLSMILGLNKGHIGIAFLAGTVICLLLTRVFKPKDLPDNEGGSVTFKISIMVWVLVFVNSVLLLLDSFANYYLSLAYFLSISALALIIAYQTLGPNKLTKAHVFVILAEILVLALFTTASVLYLFPVTIGNDSVLHSNYVNSIIDSGNLYSSDYLDQYANYPVYHLSFVGIMLLSGINIQSAQLVLALVQILAVLFVFILCIRIFNERIALLSTLLIMLSTQMIIPRYSFYPSNYAIIYFILLLFVLFCFRTKKPNLWPVILIALLTINLVHPFVTIVTSFTLVLLYVLNKLFGFRKIVDLRHILLSAGLMLIQIVRPIPGNVSLLSQLALQIQSILSRPKSVTSATLSQYQNWSDMVLYDMGFMLLIIFGVSGALLALKLCLKNDRNTNEEWKGKVFFLSALTLIMTPIPYVVTIFAPNSLPERWFVFTTILLGVFAAVTVYLFARASGRLRIVTLLAVPFIIFFAITGVQCNPNTHIYLDHLSTMPSLKVSETFAAAFFNQHVNLYGVQANSLFAQWVNLSLNTEDHYIEPDNMAKVGNAGVLLIRNYDMENGFTIPGAKGKLVDINKPTSEFISYVSGANKFYDNGEIRAVLGYEISAHADDRQSGHVIW